MFKYMFTMTTETIVPLLISGLLWIDRSMLMINLKIDRKFTLSENVTNIVGFSSIFLSIMLTIIYFLMISVI
jgi:hypothetical protein